MYFLSCKSDLRIGATVVASRPRPELEKCFGTDWQGRRWTRAGLGRWGGSIPPDASRAGAEFSMMCRVWWWLSRLVAATLVLVDAT